MSIVGRETIETYRRDGVAVIRNLFDEEPPFVDGTEILSFNNTPIGYGYDLRGRTYFFNIAATFGGGE